MELSDQSNSRRYNTLLNSYCNLIEREVIYAEQTPVQCELEPAAESKICMAEFHRCISACDDRARHCAECELKAEQCLNSFDST